MAMTPTQAHADTTVTYETVAQIWGSDNFTVASGGNVLVPSASAILTSGSVGTLVNLGLILGGFRAISVGANTDAVINNAQIAGAQTGIYNFGGLIGSITNSGTILSANGSAIHNQGGQITSLINQSGGTIVAGALGTFGTQQYAIKNDSFQIETLTNQQSATISGGRVGIYNGTVSSIGLLSNSGSIYGGSIGISNAGNITSLINLPSGIITSTNNTAIYNSGSIATLANSGTISDGMTGVSNTGSITTLRNDHGGIISTTGTAVRISSGSIGTIVNSGLISGGSSAIAILSSARLGGLSNTGTIAGGITNVPVSVLTISGVIGTFGTLTGSSGSIGASDIGIISSSGGVLFTSGSQLLNDDIDTNNLNTGTLGTVTNASGVLQVNNQISINGNYAQSAGATLAIGVGSSAQTNGTITSYGFVANGDGYGRLIVSGSAVLASNSTIQLVQTGSYAFAVGQRYVVIQAASSGTNYNAGSLNYLVSGYSATGVQSTAGSYDYLVVTVADAITGSSSIVNRATNQNAWSMLNSLYNYGGADQALLNVFNPAVALSGSGDVNRAGAQLSPAATTNAVVSASSSAFTAVQAAAGNRLDTLRTAQANGSSGVATGESTLAPAVWGRLFGGQANQALRDGVSGYHASYGGFMLGSDVQVNPDWRVGGLFSLARTNIGSEGDNTGSSAGVNTYGLSAYAGYDGHPWYVNLSAGIGRQMYSTTRAINYTGFSGTANGAFKGLLYTATAQAGYPLQVGSFTITPLASLGYSTLRQDAYTESGGNGAALSINASTSNSLKSQLGTKLETGFATRYGELRPFVQLGWNHEFHDTALTSTGIFAADTTGTTAFATQGAAPMRNTAQLSLGATLLRTGNLTLAARYTLEGARGYTAQTGDVTLRWQY